MYTYNFTTRVIKSIYAQSTPIPELNPTLLRAHPRPAPSSLLPSSFLPHHLYFRNFHARHSTLLPPVLPPSMLTNLPWPPTFPLSLANTLSRSLFQNQNCNRPSACPSPDLQECGCPVSISKPFGLTVVDGVVRVLTLP